MRLETDPYRELGELVMQVRRRWLREQAERQERASVWTTVTGPVGWRRCSYREAAKMQRRECANAGTMWSASAPDAEVAEVLRGLGTDREWLAMWQREARKQPSVVAEPFARGRIEEERRRLGELYRRGVITERRPLAEIAAEVGCSVRVVLRDRAVLREWAATAAQADDSQPAAYDDHEECRAAIGREDRLFGDEISWGEHHRRGMTLDETEAAAAEEAP